VGVAVMGALFVYVVLRGPRNTALAAADDEAEANGTVDRVPTA
jgi:uncharacterized membrane protein